MNASLRPALWFSFLLVNGLACLQGMAQEPMAREEARKAALTIESLPMDWGEAFARVKVDVLDAVGFKGSQGAGIIIIPAQCLQADKLETSETAQIALGRIYLKDLALGTRTDPVQTELLFQRPVSDGEIPVTVHAGILMAVHQPSGSWNLEVRGPGKKPLWTAPMARHEKVTPTPLEMDIVPTENGALLTLDILGRFEAEIPVRRP